MKRPIVAFLLVYLYLLITTFDISAGETIKIKRITGTIEFDGKPDEAAWQSVEQFPLTMLKPNSGSAPSEKSDIRIGYDNEFLWIGASLYMRDASKILEITKKRDQVLNSCDAFGIILDTYKDNENGLAFFTTPTGQRTDYAISNDAIQNGDSPGMNTSINMSWNTFWDVKTRIDGQGWYIEMKIPFSSLKFKPVGDIVTMGLIIRRNISANTETDTYPSIDPKYGYLAPNKPSLAAPIQIEGARPTRPVYFSPYFLGGYSRDYVLNDSETHYIREDNPKLEAGLDIKYNINSNLTLDLTGNTDFAQVEADDPQVNLTRYSLFFPEKRMFFQERSSLFDFSLGGQFDNLFYSRNIGMADGVPERIYGGARLTGRLGKWDMGFLDMQTAGKDTIPAENLGVLRIRHQVINQKSYVGGIITSRMGMNGDHNLAYGVDGIFNLYGDDYLNVKWSQTYDNETGSKLNSLDPSLLLIDWERRTQKGLGYKVNYLYSGDKFNPGLGFIMKGDIQGISGRIQYGWIPDEKSRLFNYNVNLKAEQYHRLDDGRLESMLVSPGAEFITKKGFFTGFSIRMEKEGVREAFDITDSVQINAGDYSFTSAQIMFGTPSSKRISMMSDLSIGRFYDGNIAGLMSMINFNLSSSFNLLASYDFNAIRFPDRTKNNSLNIHSLNLKALVMFSTKLSATLAVQFVNTDNNLLANFRLRYNPREGNDFYLVVNDYRRVGNKIPDPETPGFYDETVMVKFIHTFIF